MQVGDLVRCNRYYSYGIIISLFDVDCDVVHANVYWISGRSSGEVGVRYQATLEVVCK